MSKLKFFILCLSTSVISACASTIGTKPADTSPRLVNSTNAQGVSWDNNSLFGPVPANQQLAGDKLCQKELGNLKARAYGYHPKALDKAGKPMDGGGFLCTTPLL